MRDGNEDMATPTTGRRPGAVVALLVGVALAGCLSPLSGPSFQLPVPEMGAAYVYEGPDDSRLKVTVDSTAIRVDGHLQPHETVVFKWRYRRPAGDFTYTYWEAVDRSTGHVVQQVAQCAAYDWFKRTDDPPRACWDERAVVHLAGAAGLPGAFGAGPLWNRTIGPGLTEVPLQTQGAIEGPDLLSYRTEATPNRRDCLRLRSHDTISRVRSLPHMPLQGPITLCPDRALPIAFTSMRMTGSRVNAERFRLVRADHGDETLSLGGGGDDPWDTDDLSVGMRDWQGAVPIDPTDGNPFWFPFHQAHRWALENNSLYREILKQEPKGIVWFSRPMPGGGGTMAGGVTRYNESVRKLSVVDPTGSGLTVTLVKQRQEPKLPHENATIRQADESTFMWNHTVPTRSTIVARMADAKDSLQLAKQITGQPISHGGPQQTFNLRYPTDQTGRSIGPRDQDAYTIIVWLDPDPPHPFDGGLRAPYGFVVDGRTGAVEFLDINRTRLPIRQHV